MENYWYRKNCGEVIPKKFLKSKSPEEMQSISYCRRHQVLIEKRGMPNLCIRCNKVYLYNQLKICRRCGYDFEIISAVHKRKQKQSPSKSSAFTPIQEQEKK